ncbi:MAG: DUF1292 domain-containing protein [Eubacterium sp.]
MANDGTIMLTAEDGSEDAFFVWEKADIAGREYLLVSNVDPTQEDSEEEDEEISLILRAVKEENDSVLYDIVEDEEELRIISKYFEELLEDVELS